MRKMIVLGLAALLLSSCAAESETLKLENVLELEAKRAERLKAKEAAKIAAPPVPANAAPSPVPVIPLTEPSPAPDYNFEPSELSEFRAPQGFSLMKTQDLKSAEALSKLLFTPTAGWKAKSGNVMILTSMTKMDPVKLGLMNKKDFMADVGKTGREYGSYYQQTYSTPSSYEVEDEDEILFLKVTSKYLESNYWRTDIRYIYFYRPDYRLNMLITGNDEDIALHWKEIRASLDSFLKKVRANHSEPFPFRQDLEEVRV